MATSIYWWNYPQAPDSEEGARLDLLEALQRALGERRMDVLLTWPGASASDIECVGRLTGVPV